MITKTTITKCLILRVQYTSAVLFSLILADWSSSKLLFLQVNECVDGKLPLHVAAVKGHNDIMRTLLDAGADVSAGDSDGDVAIHYAVFR